MTVSMTKLKYFDYTNYPNIFNKVYWGVFNGKPENIIINNRNKFVEDYEISGEYNDYNVTNMIRTKTRLFDILYIGTDDFKSYKKSNYYDNKKFKNYYLYDESITHFIPIKNNDTKYIKVHKLRTRHNEYYISKKYPKCIIHVFSNHTTEKEHKLIIEDGYKEIYPIYSPHQRTYIKIAPKLIKDYRILKNKYNI
jgi:hypothetical protein